jgi:hypothetical protein
MFKELNDGRQGGVRGHFGNQARVFEGTGGSQSEEVAARQGGQEVPEGSTLMAIDVRGAGKIKRGKLRQGAFCRALQPTVGSSEAQDGSRGKKSPRSEEGRVTYKIEESVERGGISLEAAATRDAFRQLLAGLVGVDGRSDATGLGSLPNKDSCAAGGASTKEGERFQMDMGADEGELGGQAAPSSAPSAGGPKRGADRAEKNGAKGKKRERKKRGSLGMDYRARGEKGGHAETASQKQEGLRVLGKVDTSDGLFAVRNSEDSWETLNVSESWGAAVRLTRLDSGQCDDCARISLAGTLDS